jgi:hypothetical protein
MRRSGEESTSQDAEPTGVPGVLVPVPPADKQHHVVINRRVARTIPGYLGRARGLVAATCAASRDVNEVPRGDSSAVT